MNLNQYLVEACSQGDLDKVKTLVDKGACVGITRNSMAASDASWTMSDLETTPLLFAAAEGHLEIVKYLVKQGANVNEQNQDGYSPLHFGANCGHLEIVEFLLTKGANPQCQDHKNSYPLDFCLQKGFMPIACLLIQYSKDLTPFEKKAPVLVKAERNRRLKNLLDQHTQSLELS